MQDTIVENNLLNRALNRPASLSHRPRLVANSKNREYAIIIHNRTRSLMTLMHFNDTDAATPHRERVSRDALSTTSLYIRIATDRETSYSGLPIGSQLASERIVYSRAADNVVGACIQAYHKHICICVCIRIYARETRERHLARMLIQSNQPDGVHSKKPALQINHSNVVRCPALRKKESTRRDRLFRNRRYIFLQ